MSSDPVLEIKIKYDKINVHSLPRSGNNKISGKGVQDRSSLNFPFQRLVVM
jgi:hypothetical protein